MEPIKKTQTPLRLKREDLIDWLRLLRSENVGALTFNRLIKRYEGAAEALLALPTLAQNGGRREPLKITTREDAVRELDQLESFGGQMIAQCDDIYPPLLKSLDYAPPLLSVKGNIDLLTADLFAIVGARNASMGGKKITAKIAKEMGERGWTIVSGLARGIDTAAHQAALKTGTIAVVAGGIDQVYPTENQKLFEDICEQGLVIAESPFGTQPQATLFPKRNRIVSGISRGILVVEAAYKSGSLITARYANDQGRDVFAIPGSPLDPRARGTNHLLREGAILTECVEDIERELAPYTPAAFENEDKYQAESHHPTPDLDRARKQILENLGYNPIKIDEIIRECHLSPADVNAVILELEIAGRVLRDPGGLITLL